MPSYAITGSNRGIGYALLKQLSDNPDNTVVGLVRDVNSAQAKVAELQRTNIHFVEFTLDEYDVIKVDTYSHHGQQIC
jgi:NAD(P)-dependent dehydrogenase (short-subunit alcohol dehydrogenase family)